MKGQIVPGGPGKPVVFETQDGEHHEITNCLVARMSPIERQRLTYIDDLFPPPREYEMHAEFRLTEFTIKRDKGYDYDAEAFEEADEIEPPQPPLLQLMERNDA